MKRTKVAWAISDQMIPHREPPNTSVMNSSCDFTPGRLPRLVLGDGGVDLGFLDLLGGCAVAQGLQRAVLVHRNHHSGFATETDDVVTVVLWRRAHATMLARRAVNPAVWMAWAAETHG
jgi:hypothetical protein